MERNTCRTPSPPRPRRRCIYGIIYMKIKHLRMVGWFLQYRYTHTHPRAVCVHTNTTLLSGGPSRNGCLLAMPSSVFDVSVILSIQPLSLLRRVLDHPNALFPSALPISRLLLVNGFDRACSVSAQQNPLLPVARAVHLPAH